MWNNIQDDSQDALSVDPSYTSHTLRLIDGTNTEDTYAPASSTCSNVAESGLRALADAENKCSSKSMADQHLTTNRALVDRIIPSS